MCSSEAAPRGEERCFGSLAQQTIWVLCGQAGRLYTHRWVNLGPLLNCCLSCCSSASMRASSLLFFFKCASLFYWIIFYFIWITWLAVLVWGVLTPHSQYSMFSFMGLSSINVCVCVCVPTWEYSYSQCWHPADWDIRRLLAVVN